MKRKIKIAKNVAKVPERRTKMRRKKREKRSSGRWFCRREIFIFGWCVWCMWLSDLGSGFGKIVKCQTYLQKKCQKGLHNDMEYFLVLLFGTFLIIPFVRIRKSEPYGAPEKTSKKT